MNTEEACVKFVKDNVKIPAKILDLGAGEYEDAKALEILGYSCEGVDIKSGVDLENSYLSENAPFDLVMSNFVLHFIKNKKQLIMTAYQNIKEGGLFYFQDLEHQAITGDMYLSMKEIEDLIASVGFEVISSKKSKYFDNKEGHKHWHNIVEVSARK